MKSDSRIENLDVRELEHRLEMAMSSPLLADWECTASAEASANTDGDADGEVKVECEYTYGS